jgi:hypothetical protein
MFVSRHYWAGSISVGLTACDPTFSNYRIYRLLLSHPEIHEKYITWENRGGLPVEM